MPTIYLLHLYMQSFVHMVTLVLHVVLLFMQRQKSQIIQYLNFMCPALDQKKLIEYYEKLQRTN